MNKSHEIFIEAFRMNTVVRCLSAEYWLGVLHSLETQELALKGRATEFDTNPFDRGTHEASCWNQGQREGQRLWRINTPRSKTIPIAYGDIHDHVDC